LIACFDSVENLDFGARWAADVRDVLPEPEASDLYLILSAEGLSEGECSRLESDEQFCRKYVLRPGEDPKDFVLRTFLCPLESNDDGLDLSDPVIAAMKFTEAENDWLDAQQQDYWKALFLSSLESTDIARLLLDDGAPEE